MFRPWPCPSHYAGHLATMPSADFCFITATVTCNSAIGLHRIRSQWMMRFLCAKALVYQSLTGIHRSLVKQISPDKSMDCLCTAASFTVAVRSHGFRCLVPTHLQPTPHMMFLFISSQIC